jgi:hypothetical protein
MPQPAFHTTSNGSLRTYVRLACCVCMVLWLGIPSSFVYANKKNYRVPDTENKREAEKNESGNKRNSEKESEWEMGKNRELGRNLDKHKNEKEGRNAGTHKKSGPARNQEAERYAEIEKYTESEILIELNVPRLGNLEVPSIIYGQDVYLPVKQVFDFLKIKCLTSENLDSVYGYFIHPSAEYLIDNAESAIYYQGQEYLLENDEIIQTETGIFLKIRYFGEVFGLDCIFNFRSLSVVLTTKLDVPAIREKQLDLMRKNIRDLTGNKKADSTINRKFKVLQIGMVDYTLNASQVLGVKSQAIFNVNVGGMLLGGDVTGRLGINAKNQLDYSQGGFRWRYVNNEGGLIKQVTVGQLTSRTINSLDAGIHGVQVTNASTYFKRSFGTYTLTDKTEPGWTVELYVNNVLVNYTKADASGIFVFEVPMVYGNSIIKLRFFGPFGEEKTIEQVNNIPFNFVQVHQLEYTLAAGLVNDSTGAFFSKSMFNYGLNKFITVGGGMEFLSTLANGPSMPYMNASVRVSKNILVSTEITHNVRSKYSLNYNSKGNVSVDVNYTTYNQNQKFNKFNSGEERQVLVTMPIKFGAKHISSRLTLNQFVNGQNTSTQAQLMFSGNVLGINGNLSTIANMYNSRMGTVLTQLSSHFRLPWRIRGTSQLQYDLKNNGVSMVTMALDRSFGNKYQVSVRYQNNPQQRVQTFGLNFSTRLNFANASLGVSHANGFTNSTQSLSGSLIYNSNSQTVKATPGSNVGRAGLTVYPFLDLNHNGKRDAGEPKVKGMKLRMEGGVIQRNEKDTSVFVTGLEAYRRYFLEIESRGFENVAWMLRSKSYDIEVAPNYMTVLEVPVLVMGEVSGNVSVTSYGNTKGLARILVNIYDKQNNLAGKTLAETDGYFTFLGLPPGEYTARIDGEQLNKLSLVCLTDEINFTIHQKIDGDVVEGLEFDIRKLEK